MLQQAVKAGFVFALDTQARAPGTLNWQANGCEKAIEMRHFVQARIMNTRPVDELLTWTSDHRESAMITAAPTSAGSASSHDGVETWHSFSAGAHYDPDNVAPTACSSAFDEHIDAPGSRLRLARTSRRRDRQLGGLGPAPAPDGAGTVALGDQALGGCWSSAPEPGIRHCEVNASARGPLRSCR